MVQILTYPYGIKYSRTNWDSQVKQGTGGSIPCNKVIFAGTSVVNTGGEEWWGSGNGNTSYSFSDANANPWNQTWGGTSQKGLHYWLRTKENKYQQSRWFDLGAEGGKNHGVSVSNSAKSSWLREVTALWFLFNGHDTTQTRDCYVRVEKAAIRYRDPNGKVNIKKVTEKLGEYTYMDGVRGSTKKMFGYALSSSNRSTVCGGNYHFLGLRVQIQLRRGSTGTTTDTLQGGITGVRLGLGTSPTGNYNTTNKRALVLRGDTTWTTFAQDDKTRDMLETR